jgi:hypothetical protein
MPFVKLDTKILDSTLWIERECREVFITALLMAEPREILEAMEVFKVASLEPLGLNIQPGWYGFVGAAGQGIIRRAMVSESEGMAALERLCAPDQGSRTPDYEGRRMARVAGGYLILNYMKYRDHDYTAAERQRNLRARRKMQNSEVSLRVMNRDRHVISRIAEADTEADADKSNPVDRSELVFELFKLYPKNRHRTKPSRIEQEELMEAIILDGKELVTAGITNFAKSVQGWPKEDQRFIPELGKFLKRQEYLADPAKWERKQTNHESAMAIIDRLARDDDEEAGIGAAQGSHR